MFDNSPQATGGALFASLNMMMALFNVGRPSIRGALSALSRKGLVKLISGEKAKVVRPSADVIIGELSGMAKDSLTRPGGIRNFEQLRQFFESSLVRYAAANASDEQITWLEMALGANRKTIHDDEQFTRSDIEFHRILAEIPGNPISLEVISATFYSCC